MLKQTLPALVLAVSSAITLSSCVVAPEGLDGGGYGNSGYGQQRPSGYSNYQRRPDYGPQPSGYSNHHDRYDQYNRPGYSQQPYGSSYRSTPDYRQGGYSSYPQPQPQRNSSSSEKSRAYEIAYKLGRDDFDHKRSKHMDRHSGKFDAVTHDSFRDGYEAGYDFERRRDTRR